MSSKRAFGLDLERELEPPTNWPTKASTPATIATAKNDISGLATIRRVKRRYSAEVSGCTQRAEGVRRGHLFLLPDRLRTPLDRRRSSPRAIALLGRAALGRPALILRTAAASSAGRREP